MAECREVKFGGCGSISVRAAFYVKTLQVDVTLLQLSGSRSLVCSPGRNNRGGRRTREAYF